MGVATLLEPISELGSDSVGLEVLFEGLGRLASGDAGREGGSWVVVVVSLGGGVVSLVMIWSRVGIEEEEEGMEREKVRCMICSRDASDCRLE